eukprot:scaffold764_cov140-Isochrysis_galbana.AAC.2
MTKAASGWLIGEPIISADPSVRDVFEMEVVVPRALAMAMGLMRMCLYSGQQDDHMMDQRTVLKRTAHRHNWRPS